MIDARGYVCPMPVILVQKEMKAKNPSEVTVLVDNHCAVENVTRFGKSQGFEVSVSSQNMDFLLTLKK